jgi:hypothetical protein
MDDDDSLKRPSPPVRSRPLEALDRALADVQISCDELAMAIRDHDDLAAETAACDAVASYLIASAVIWWLEVRPQAAEDDLRAASLGLRDAERVLGHLFECAMEQLPSHSLRRMLQQLTLNLASTGGDAPCGSNTLH